MAPHSTLRAPPLSFKGTLLREELRPVRSYEPDMDSLVAFQVESEIRARQRAAWVMAPVAIIAGVWMLFTLLGAVSGTIMGSGMMIFQAILMSFGLMALWQLLTHPGFAKLRWSVAEFARRRLGLEHFQRVDVMRQLREIPVEIVVDPESSSLSWTLLEEQARVLQSHPSRVSPASLPTALLEAAADGDIGLDSAQVVLDLAGSVDEAELATLEVRDARSGQRLAVELDARRCLEAHERSQLQAMDRPAVRLAPEEQDAFLSQLLEIASASDCRLPPSLERRAHREVVTEAATATIKG